MNNMGGDILGLHTHAVSYQMFAHYFSTTGS